MGHSLIKNYLLVSEKKWHDKIYTNLIKQIPGNWHRITEKKDFNANHVATLNPAFIFIPHWSYMIEGGIYEQYQCIVFHMTDLPFGRGGSPLQNLIIRGLEQTKISAIRVEKGIDTGDVYLKKELSLAGSAKEIFLRASAVIEEMIFEIIEQDLKPLPQKGEVTVFIRRKPEEGNIGILTEMKQVYDYIRMLDCEGYPNAFLETEQLRFEFENATLQNDKTVTANVRIIKK